MRNPIKTEENNQRRLYMYVKIREHATNVVNMVTIEEIVGRKKKQVL